MSRYMNTPRTLYRELRGMGLSMAAKLVYGYLWHNDDGCHISGVQAISVSCACRVLELDAETVVGGLEELNRAQVVQWDPHEEMVDVPAIRARYATQGPKVAKAMRCHIEGMASRAPWVVAALDDLPEEEDKEKEKEKGSIDAPTDTLSDAPPDTPPVFQPEGAWTSLRVRMLEMGHPTKPAQRVTLPRGAPAAWPTIWRDYDGLRGVLDQLERYHRHLRAGRGDAAWWSGRIFTHAAFARLVADCDAWDAEEQGAAEVLDIRAQLRPGQQLY